MKSRLLPVLITLLAAPLFAQTGKQESNLAGRMIAATGAIDPGSLGRTPMHEHLIADFNVRDDTDDSWSKARNPNSVTAAAPGSRTSWSTSSLSSGDRV